MDPNMISAVGGSLVQPFASLAGIKYSSDLAQARSDQAWSREMEASNTSHQREVEDLRKAGLNPILSGLGGGGAPMASAKPAPTPDFSGAAGSLGNNVLNVAQFANELRRTDADIRKTDAETQLALSSSMLNMLNQDNVSTVQKKMAAETALTNTTNQLRALEREAARAALPGQKLTGKLEGSPTFRGLKVGGEVAKGALHALTLGLAFKGLHGAQARSAPKIQTYDNRHMPIGQ